MARAKDGWGEGIRGRGLRRGSALRSKAACSGVTEVVEYGYEVVMVNGEVSEL